MKNTIPKTIENKIERLNKTLDNAYKLRLEIEAWATSKGISVYDDEWCDCVVDDSSMVCGIYKEALEELLKSL